MSFSPDPWVHATALADLLTGQGDLNSEAWRRALVEVHRHQFVPDIAYAQPDGPGDGYPVDRLTDPQTWWRAVYSDTALITQRDDGRSAVTDSGLASSSCSAPGVVSTFLDLLDPLDNHRILEIGTGTGWTAALLSHRVGEQNVTSVELDPVLSVVAAANVKRAGYDPRLITGDGADGYPADAPYDRVHATCAVAAVPHTWIAQTRPGGTIVTPYSPGYGYGWLAHLHVAGDGTATGRFPHLAGYMMLRSQRPAGGAAFDWVHESSNPAESVTRLDPRHLDADSRAADLFIAASVPGVQKRLYFDDDGDSGEATFWILENSGHHGSWASVDYEPGATEFVVKQHGDRRLWDEVEDAYLRWLALGRPVTDRFGMTITPQQQTIWLDTPANVVNSYADGQDLCG